MAKAECGLVGMEGFIQAPQLLQCAAEVVPRGGLVVYAAVLLGEPQCLLVSVKGFIEAPQLPQDNTEVVPGTSCAISVRNRLAGIEGECANYHEVLQASPPVQVGTEREAQVE